MRVPCALLPRVPMGDPPASVPVPLSAGTTGEENVPRGLLETCNFIGCPCCMTNPMTRAMERLGLNCDGLMPASTSPALGAGPPPAPWDPQGCPRVLSATHRGSQVTAAGDESPMEQPHVSDHNHLEGRRDPTRALVHTGRPESPPLSPKSTQPWLFSPRTLRCEGLPAG